MKEAVETARKAATSKATVLLSEKAARERSLARAIHSWSEKKTNRSSPSTA